jgi:RecA-family ATPase
VSKPIIVPQADGYLYEFIEEKLMISASRIRVHSSDGRVTGLLLISSQEASRKPIYPKSTFNFSAPRSRTELINTLTRADDRWDWQTIIFQLCVSVEELAKRGEPVEELWTSDESVPPEWLLEPLLYKGLPTVVFGEKAVCKSIISLLVYAALTLPWHDNPLGWKIKADKSCKVFLADWEVTPEVARYNLKRIQEGMGFAPISLFYRRCKLPLMDDIEQIKNHLEKINADVIIIDSLGFAVGGDLNNADQALKFTTALNQLNCASFIIAQTSKDKRAKVKSTYGSTFFEYFSRNIWELRKTREDSDDEFDIALFNTYCNLGKRNRPMGYHVSFTEKTIRVEQAEITAPDLVERLGTWSRIYDLLKRSGSLPAKDIADALSVSLDTVSKTLRRYQQRRHVIKLSDGSWGLVIREGGVQ